MDHASGSPSKYMTTIYNYFCIKMIFLDFLKVKKNYENMLQNAPLKFFWGEACPRTPLANAWLRHVSQAAPPNNRESTMADS